MSKKRTAWGLDLAGYSTGKSGLARADLLRGKTLSITVFEEHPLSTKRHLPDGLPDCELSALRYMLRTGLVCVDVPIDLQELLVLNPPAHYVWQLTKRPVDFAFVGQPPLASWIGALVARFRRLWRGIDPNGEVLGDRLFETYPAASLRLLGLPHEGYKGCSDQANQVREQIASGLGLPAGLHLDDDELDSVLCALTGIAEDRCVLKEDKLQRNIAKKAHIPKDMAVPPRGYVLLKKVPGYCEIEFHREAEFTAGG